MVCDYTTPLIFIYTIFHLMDVKKWSIDWQFDQYSV